MDEWRDKSLPACVKTET